MGSATVLVETGSNSSGSTANYFIQTFDIYNKYN
jgi:hypothetical protein